MSMFLTKVELQRISENPKPSRAGEETVDLSVPPMVDTRHCRELESRRSGPVRRSMTIQAKNALSMLQQRGHLKGGR
jgi:hypothetical protein